MDTNSTTLSLTPTHLSLFLSPSPYLGMLKGPDKGSFYNERFLRGMPFLSKKMKRIGGVKDVDASINNEPLLQKISDIHPPPQEVPRNTLDYLVLSTINRCIQEEGPKAKMPFVPGPPLAKSSSRKRKAESSDSKLPAASAPPSTLAASSNDSLSSLEDHQEESQEESNTASHPNTLLGPHHAGDLIQQPQQQQQLNNPLLLPNQVVDQNQLLQQMQSQNQSQQQMNSLLLQIMMAGTNPAAAALVPNSQNQQGLWQNQLLGAGGVPTTTLPPFTSSNSHPGAPPSQQDHSLHAQVAQPHAQVAQAQATQGKTSEHIMCAYHVCMSCVSVMCRLLTLVFVHKHTPLYITSHCRCFDTSSISTAGSTAGSTDASRYAG